MKPIAIIFEHDDGTLVDVGIEELPGGGYTAKYGDVTAYVDVVNSGRRCLTPAQWVARA